MAGIPATTQHTFQEKERYSYTPVTNYQTTWYYILADCNLHELLRPQITYKFHSIAEGTPKPKIFLGDKRSQFNNHQYTVLKTDKHELDINYKGFIPSAYNCQLTRQSVLSRFADTQPSAITHMPFLHCSSAFVRTVNESQNGVNFLLGTKC